jgi:hypothetical protein
MQKERKLWLFSRNKKKMFVAPIRYEPVKNSLQDYTIFVREAYPKLMSEY